MHIELSFTALVLIISFIIIFSIIEYRINKKLSNDARKRSQAPKFQKLDLQFEKDMVPLTTIIEHEYRQYYIYNIKPTFTMGNPLFSEEERLQIVADLMTQVKANLSEAYITHMTTNYFSKQGLDNLITDLVYNKLNEAVATQNFKSVKVLGTSK